MPLNESESSRAEREFLLQVSALRQDLDGQVVIAHGGVWSAEAREPNRKQMLHQQFRLARQLRASLEAAAERSEQARTQDERWNILTEHSTQFNMLVALSEAVRGGYTLRDYTAYARFVKNYEARVQEERQNDHAVIVNQLVAMAKERAAISNGQSVRTNLTATVAVSNPEAAAPVGVSNPPPASVKRRYSHTIDLTSDDDSTNGSPYIADANLSSGDEDYSPDAKSYPRLRKSTQRIKRRNVISRRCHDCKSATTYFRRCHYWFLTGTKCKRTFCSRCLISKYGCTDEEGEYWESNNPDWQ
jgi:hypothetical protein